MTPFPKTELIVKVDDETILHVEPLDERGVGSVLMPGPTQDDERLLAMQMLVDAMMILTGRRPDGNAPTFALVMPAQLGLTDEGKRKGSHLKLVQSEEEPS